jgi:hypothetical protein
MMVDVFGPSVDKHFEQGESSATANGQPPRQDASAQPPQQICVFSQLNMWIVNQSG